MQPSDVSTPDLMAAILNGKLDVSELLQWASKLSENPRFMEVAVLVGCLAAFLLFWKKSGGKEPARVEAAPAPAPKRAKKTVRDTEDADLGKKKVTLFFGSQTGTAERFAKVRFRSFWSFLTPQSVKLVM